jgi:tetratricopeptide (TPR) repeat protein
MAVSHRARVTSLALGSMCTALKNVVMALSVFALAAFTHAQNASQTSSASATASAETVETADEMLKHGRQQEAIDVLLKLVTERPDTPGANRELGIAYYRTGKLKDAESSFAAAMSDDLNDRDAVQMRGLTLYRLGRPEYALPYLERARQRTETSDVDVNYVLGRCYIDAREYDKARSAFATQYGLDPESGAAYALVSHMLLIVELPEVAAENAQKALKLSPNIAMAHFVLGKVYLARGDFKQALKEFEEERIVNPTYPALYQFLGDLYSKMGQRQQAQHALTEALSLDQTSTGPFILMGRLFLEDNDPQTAVSYLQHAEQMDPSNFITHYLLGQAFRQMGRKEDAKRELDVVSKMHSDEIKSLQ